MEHPIKRLLLLLSLRRFWVVIQKHNRKHFSFVEKTIVPQHEYCISFNR